MNMRSTKWVSAIVLLMASSFAGPAAWAQSSLSIGIDIGLPIYVDPYVSAYDYSPPVYYVAAPVYVPPPRYYYPPLVVTPYLVPDVLVATPVYYVPDDPY